MATHSVSFIGVVGTPQAGVIYKVYSGANNYGYWVYYAEGNNFVQVGHNPTVTMVDISSYLNSVSNPANQDIINPTGYMFSPFDPLKKLLFDVTAWKCKRPL